MQPLRRCGLINRDNHTSHFSGCRGKSEAEGKRRGTLSVVGQTGRPNLLRSENACAKSSLILSHLMHTNTQTPTHSFAGVLAFILFWNDIRVFFYVLILSMTSSIFWVNLLPPSLPTASSSALRSPPFSIYLPLIHHFKQFVILHSGGTTCDPPVIDVNINVYGRHTQPYSANELKR